MPRTLRRGLLQEELACLVEQASGAGLTGALDVVAEGVKADQVPAALAVATAAREDG